jgi:hypothetical protein
MGDTMTDNFTKSCPYNCGHAQDFAAFAGFQLITCGKCGKPWVMETTYVPFMQARTVEGYGVCVSQYPTPTEIEQDIREDPEQILCVDCGKPISPNSDFRLCEDCLKDDDVENQPLPISTNSVFVKCPNAPNSFYRLDGDYVEVKYKKSSPVRTTWSDIHVLCEEENPTYSIALLLGDESNTQKVAAVNAFVRAVKGGLIEVDA